MSFIVGIVVCWHRVYRKRLVIWSRSIRPLHRILPKPSSLFMAPSAHSSLPSVYPSVTRSRSLTLLLKSTPRVAPSCQCPYQIPRLETCLDPPTFILFSSGSEGVSPSGVSCQYVLMKRLETCLHPLSSYFLRLSWMQRLLLLLFLLLFGRLFAPNCVSTIGISIGRCWVDFRVAVHIATAVYRKMT